MITCVPVLMVTSAPATAAGLPVPQEAVVMGEIALSGEVRPVAHAGLRLKESAKLGFERGWAPSGTEGPTGIALTRFGKLRELVDQILGR